MRTGAWKYLKGEGFELTPLETRLVMEDFFEEIIEAVITKGDKVTIPSLGTLGVYSKRNAFNKHYINRGESFKLRQKIIDNGGIPKKNIKDSDGKVIGDNGGEDWIVYRTNDIIYYLCINNRTRIHIKDKLFLFKPTEVCSRKLYEHIISNPLKGIFYETDN